MQGCIQTIDKNGGGGQTGFYKMKSHMCKLSLMIWKAKGGPGNGWEILNFRASKVASGAF